MIPEGIFPAMMEIWKEGSLVGYIFVCVDNISVVCTDASLRNKWRKRLQENAEALGMAPFKEVILATERTYEFIGMAYTEGSWRHCGDRISRWVEKYGVQRPEGEAGGLMHVPALRKLSVKDVQRFVGVLVWDVRLRVNMDTMR